MQIPSRCPKSKKISLTKALFGFQAIFCERASVFLSPKKSQHCSSWKKKSPSTFIFIFVSFWSRGQRVQKEDFCSQVQHTNLAVCTGRPCMCLILHQIYTVWPRRWIWPKSHMAFARWSLYACFGFSQFVCVSLSGWNCEKFRQDLVCAATRRLIGI